MNTIRLEAFNSLQRHPWLGRVFMKLSDAEVKLCRDFILEHKNLTHDQFILKVNRMFLDKPVRPKNWTRIMELLTVAMTAARLAEADLEAKAFKRE